MNSIVKFASWEWPKVLLVAIVVAAAYWQFGLSEGVTESQFQAAEAGKNQAQASLESTQKAVADLKKFKEELDTMTAQFQQVVELMPAESNVADFMLQIREEATKAGARVKKLEPKKEAEKVNFYETRKLEISLEGSYAQVLTFLSNLSRMKRLVTVDNIAITQAGSGDESKVAFTGSLTSYRYIAETPAPGASPAPGAPGTAAGGQPQ